MENLSVALYSETISLSFTQEDLGMKISSILVNIRIFTKTKQTKKHIGIDMSKNFLLFAILLILVNSRSTSYRVNDGIRRSVYSSHPPERRRWTHGGGGGGRGGGARVHPLGLLKKCSGGVKHTLGTGQR